MTSKSPFEYEGLSVYAKAGISSEKQRGNAGFYDTGFRYAHKFNDKFAAKLNVTYQSSEDWLANDLSNINGEGLDHSNGNSNYDGVNVYGDDFSLNLVDLALLASGTELFTNSASPLFGQNPLALLSLTENAENARISRTGFQEQSFVDYGLNNILYDFSVHFKPSNTTELILATKQSNGDNITQSVNRYVQEGSSMQHYRFELKNDNYFVRAYYNENDPGLTYDSKLAGNFITQAWKDNATFYSEYAQNYFGSLASGLSNVQAHDNARLAVDQGRPDDISSLLELAKNTNIAEGGSKLSENSGFYNVDANWNLSELINFQNIQVGGSFKSFALDLPIMMGFLGIVNMVFTPSYNENLLMID